MNARNEDFDTLDPRVRAQLIELAAKARAQRVLADETYEQTTQGADAWRDRMAQRHRFGRALDMPHRPTPAQIHAVSTAVGWVVAMVIAVLAYAAWALLS